MKRNKITQMVYLLIYFLDVNGYNESNYFKFAKSL
jgi:hypothetical protein